MYQICRCGLALWRQLPKGTSRPDDCPLLMCPTHTDRSSKNLSLDADAIKLDDTKNCRAPKKKMAPQLTEDDIGDLLYFSRAGEQQDLEQLVTSLSAGQGVSAAEILTLARDEGKSTCLHMATGNGQLGMEGGAAISVMGSFIDTMPCQTL